MGLDPRFAFWRLPRRVERLAIHVLVLDEQLAQMGQQVGRLTEVAKGPNVDELAYAAVFGGKTKAEGLEAVGVTDQSQAEEPPRGA